MAIWLLIAAVVSGLAWWQRASLFDCLCYALGLAWWLGNDRQRCRWLLAILDYRSRLTGRARPAHVPPQRWYAALANTDNVPLSPAVAHSTRIFFSEADRLWFGNQQALSLAGRQACRTLWTQSTCRVLRHATTKPQGASPGFSVACAANTSATTTSATTSATTTSANITSATTGRSA